MAASVNGEDLQDLLELNPSLNLTCEGRKVKCSLSGHQMPCRVEVISSYTQGKKYQQLVAKQQLEMDKYKKVLVKSIKRGHERQMFCKLTLRHLNKQPHHIQRHIQGKRFQKAYKKWLECQETGETFKPREGQRRPRVDPEDDSRGKKETWEGDGRDSDESEDSMSDLYPAGDFKGGQDDDDEEKEEDEKKDEEEDEEDSDSEQEMDTEVPPPKTVTKTSASTSTGSKSNKRTKLKKKATEVASTKTVTKTSATTSAGSKPNKKTKSKTKAQPKKKAKVKK